MTPEARYWAFISYSSKDRVWAEWIHSAIENYGIPAKLVRHPTPVGEPAPKSFKPVFRDRAELPAGSDLNEKLKRALATSRFLIVVCSPHAVRSEWVGKEIEVFKAQKQPPRPILALIVDGEPGSGNDRECLPAALRPYEGIAADARPTGDGKYDAKLKLLAGMLGVDFDALKQRDLAKRRRALATWLGLAFSVAAAVVLLVALLRGAKQEAGQYLQMANDRKKAEAEERRRGDLESSKQSLDRGLALCRSGDISLGLLWLARSLQSAPVADAGLQFAIRSNIAAWRESMTIARSEFSSDDPVTSVSLSSDGRLALIKSNSTSTVWDTVGSTRLRSFAASEEDPIGFDYRNRVIVSQSGNLRFWDAASSSYDEEQIGAPAFEHVEAIDARGRFLFLASSAVPIGEVLDLDAAEHAGHRQAVPEDRRSAAVSSKGTVIVTAGSDGADAWLFSPDAKDRRGPLRHGDPITAMAFSPDGRFVFTGGGNVARLWQTDTGRPVGSPIAVPSGFEVQALDVDSRGVSAVIGSTSSDNFASGGAFTDVTGTKGKAQVVPLSGTSSLPREVSYVEPFRQVQFSSDGTTFVALHKHEVRVWDSWSGTPVGPPAVHSRKPQYKFEPSLVAMAVSRDGTTLTTAGDDQRTIAWDVARGRQQARALGANGYDTAPVFRPDGKIVATSSRTDVTLWDVTRGIQISDPMSHPQIVRSLAFTPSGDLLISGVGDDQSEGGVYLWNLDRGEITGPPISFARGVTAIAVRRDGQIIAAGTAEGTIQFWNIETRKQIGREIRLERPVVQTLNFIDDGQRIAAADRSQQGGLWDVASGLRIGADYSQPHTYSPVARQVAVADGNVVTVLDVDTGKMQGEPLRHAGRVYAMAFSPDGQTLLTASGDRGLSVEKGKQQGKALLWEIGTSKAIGQPLIHNDLVVAASFSPDGGSIVTGSWDRTVQRWETSTCRPLGPPHLIDFEINPFQDEVRFAPDGQSLLAWHTGERPLVWSVPEPLEGSPEQARIAVEAWTGLRLSTAGDEIRLDDATWADLRRREQSDRPKAAPLAEWEAAQVSDPHPDLAQDHAMGIDGPGKDQIGASSVDAALEQRYEHAAPVICAAFSNDARLLATGAGKPGDEGFGEVRVWDRADGKERIYGKLKEHVDDVAFSDDGEWLATLSGLRTITVWNTTTGQLASTFTGNEQQISRMNFLPGSTSLLTSIYGQDLESHSSYYLPVDPTATLWDVRSGNKISFVSHQQEVPAFVQGQDCLLVTVSPDGKLLASGDYMGNVKLWNIPSGEEKATVSCLSSIRSLAFSPDSQTVAAGLTGDECVNLIDVSARKVRLALRGAEMQAQSLRFSPNEKAIIAVDSGKQFSFTRGSTFFTEGRTTDRSRIQLWDVEVGRLLAELTGEGSLEQPVSTDGRWIALRADGQTVAIWNAESAAEECRFRSDSKITHVMFAPDGKWFISRDENGKIQVWNNGNGAPRMSISQMWRGTLVSPDSGSVATWRNDGTVGIWNISAGLGSEAVESTAP